MKQFNQGVAIHGLFGGPANAFDYAKSRTKSLLTTNTLFPDIYPPRWKWKNTDLMVRYWYLKTGAFLKSFDFLTVIQWDILVLGDLSSSLPSHNENDLLLSGIASLEELPSGWAWTNQGNNKKEWECFKEYARLVHGLNDGFTFCQGPLYSLPRTFLERYSFSAITELCHDEIRLPFYARAWGFSCKDTGLCKDWRSAETERYFNARTNKPIQATDIILQLNNPSGRRIFHPFREKWQYASSNSACRTSSTNRRPWILLATWNYAIIISLRLREIAEIIRIYYNKHNRETARNLQIPARASTALDWRMLADKCITDRRYPSAFKSHINALLAKIDEVVDINEYQVEYSHVKLELVQSLLISRKRFDNTKKELVQVFCNTLRRLNLHVFSAVSDDLSRFSDIVVCMSCEKYLSYAKNFVRSLDPVSDRLGRLIIVGDKTLRPYCYRYDSDSRVLFVPNSDTYERLTEKTFLAYLFLYGLELNASILKVDDDTTCVNPAKLTNKVFPLTKCSNYVGRVWHPGISGLSRWWHCGRYTASSSNFLPYSRYADVSYAEGQAYAISSRALRILAISYLLYPDQIKSELSYEDVAVGKCLARCGISPLHYPLINPGLLESQFRSD
ncbi:hypothetical protein KBY96_08760 [Cyanobium sp. ATX 6A2]|uniref:hypothetical protein n=1 Tax=Cyanobium sp. ATX 6A2 TaxID=2823700 RepID=UPI0020CF6D93|nr:hypothetical protein [Cyanobium sp. ATX 6A2]MCP9888016.1 hypothetical protein [Cyanobium sp. ATX 6A2]